MTFKVKIIKCILSSCLLSIFLLSCIYQDDRKIEYYESGNIKSIKRFRFGALHGQSQWFFDNGNIDQIVIFSKGIANGNAYYFYDDGSLKSFRHWYNGKMVGWGNDFYDDTTAWKIKSVLFFNRYGQLVYAKNYDKQGRPQLKKTTSP